MKQSIIKTVTIFIMVAVLQPINAQDNMTQEIKKVNVWDTYVTKKDGAIMHFDIIAPVAIKDTVIIHDYGKSYLKTKGQEGQQLTSKQCRFCHIEKIRPIWQKEIEANGYFIIEMEGCD